MVDLLLPVLRRVVAVGGHSLNLLMKPSLNLSWREADCLMALCLA